MFFSRSIQAALLALVARKATNTASCVSSGDEVTIQNLLKAGGAGAVVQLCPGALITVSNSINITADNQEISTQGYPTGSTRATIKLKSSVDGRGTIIQGAWFNNLKLLNIQVDGDRDTNGYDQNAGGNIEIGGGSYGQVVSHVASRNPRGWSCLHLIESGTDDRPCTNATVNFNEIGPAGHDNVDSLGRGQWADGISFACTNSVVANNTITGSTDGAIVLFGAPGTKVTGNTIVSSSTDKGFGAINMVDTSYNGNYSNVVVSDNHITGELLFSVGIALGRCVWGSCASYPNHGPATIKNNIFSGNITFPIAINGWDGGLTVSGNDVSKVNTGSDFAEAGQCSSSVKSLFSNKALLVYYPPGLTGPSSLQSGFVQDTGNSVHYICTTPPLPASISYARGELSMAAGAGDQVAMLHNVFIAYQSDSNLVVYGNRDAASSTVEWASGHGVAGCPNCKLTFGTDGNLATYQGSTMLWSSGTSGTGQTLKCMNQAPWLQINNAAGKVVWQAVPTSAPPTTTTVSTKTAAPTATATATKTAVPTSPTVITVR
ncbi:hypothetical protein BGZ63DRAFT_368653 [Mariannaea sp. PMI_226]|nr:hypothetical protein BGZ63DRAFT_368653 [Mariannaea sp. PMI_226]